MPTPVLIELRPESRPAFLIIFRGLGSTIYEQADNGVIMPDTCDSDDSLFVNGLPEDYIGDKITIDGSQAGEVSFVLVQEMIPIIRNAGSCSFGRLGLDGYGPGL